MADVSQEVTINSGEHSHPTHSQISAKQEAVSLLFPSPRIFSEKMAARQVPKQVQVAVVDEDAPPAAPVQDADPEPTPEQRLEVFCYSFSYLTCSGSLRCGIAEKRLTLICISLDNKRITKQHICYMPRSFKL